MPALPAGSSLAWVPRSPAMLGGAAGFVVLLLVVFVYFNERSGLSDAQAAVVEAQADSVQLHGTIVRVKALEDTQTRLEARVEMMDQVVNGRLYWIHLMETLSQTLPDYTWLEKVDQEELPPGMARIAGATFANAAVTEYMRALEASPELERVTLVGVTRAERDTVPVQGFTLLAQFEDYDPMIVTPPDTTKEP